MIDLKFRIKSDIFPDWIYSESHYRFSYFWERWEGQYANEGFLQFNPVIEQLINDEWVEVSLTCFR